MNDVKRLCELWCKANIFEITEKDFFHTIHKEKLFETVMNSEWAKVNGTSPTWTTKYNSSEQTMIGETENE